MSNHREVELGYADQCSELLGKLPAYVRDYVRAIHNKTSPRTRYEYLNDIKTFLDYESDRNQWNPVSLKDLNSLSKDDFEEYFEYIEHYEKNGKEYSNDRVSIKRKMSALRKFFSYLFESGKIESDEIRKVDLPKLHKKEIIKLEDNEIQDLLNTVEYGNGLTKKELQYHKRDAVRDLAIIVLFLASGLRVSELAGLDMEDLDLEKCSVKVIRKGGDQATVYFSDEVLPYLQNYLAIRNRLKESVPDEKALFLSSRLCRMSVRTMERLTKKYASRAVRGKNITPHKFRATFATKLYDATNDIYLVAEVLGHEDVSTTKEHYADLPNKKKADSRNIINLRGN